MRLCERMHMSPRELEETDMQTILDWLTIMGQESDLAEEQKRRG